MFQSPAWNGGGMGTFCIGAPLGAARIPPGAEQGTM